MNKKFLIIAIVCIVFTISFARSFLGLIGAIPWHYGYSDVFNEDRISPESAKKVPYLEAPIEYPVITGFFIYAAWHAGKTLLGYALLTWIFLTLCAVVASIALLRLLKTLGLDEKRLFLFFILAPSMILFGVYNWDVIAVMFTVLALYSFYKKQYLWSAILLGLGFNAKLFPIILLPIMLLKTNLKQGIKMLLAFIAVFLILNIYFIVGSFDVWKYTYTFHSLREPNIDSIWALAGLETNTVNMLSAALFVISYVVLILNHKKYGLVSLSFASLLLFLSFNKVFSPQYIMWLLPFFVLFNAAAKRPFYLLEASNMIVFFSSLIWILYSREQVLISLSNAFVVARSLILAYLLYLVVYYKTGNVNIENKQNI